MTPTMCGSCHAPAVPLQLPNGQTRYAYAHRLHPPCRVGQVLALAASPADEFDYLDGDYRGTAFPYEAGDRA